MPVRIPERNVAGDQLLATTTNGSSELEQHVRLAGGTSPADATGSITTASSVVGGATDYSSVGNLTVTIKGAAHAGVNASFEASDDAGTTWYPVAGSREDSGVAVVTTGVLASNSSTSYAFSLFGFDRFRVRATAWTSGTANVIISAGSLPFEPVVSAVAANPPSAQVFSLSSAAAGITVATTTDALVTLVPQRNLTASGTSTTHTVTTGKALRITGITASFKGVAATSTTCNVFLRAVLTGTVTATSPVVANFGLSVPATANSHASASMPMGTFIELPSGASFGVSAVLTVANAASLLWVSVAGVEY